MGKYFTCYDFPASLAAASIPVWCTAVAITIASVRTCVVAVRASVGSCGITAIVVTVFVVVIVKVGKMAS